jgi:MFS family permease
MTKSIEKKQTTNFFIENWKDLIGSLSGFVAIIYSIGFLITNIFLLSTYEIYDFSLIKARYIYVGAIFSMFLFISFWLAFFIYNNRRKILPEKAQNNLPIVFIYVVVMSIFLGMSVGSFIKSLIILLASFDRSGVAFTAIQMRIWMVIAIWACCFVIWLLKSDFLKSKYAFPIPYSLFTAILIVGIFYARWVYPFMPFALGGGTPIAVKFIIENEKMDSLSQSIPFESNNITDTLYLIDQSELSYFVLVPSESEKGTVYPVEIKKDLILSIVHQKNVISPFLGSTEMTIKATPSPTSAP